MYLQIRVGGYAMDQELQAEPRRLSGEIARVVGSGKETEIHVIRNPVVHAESGAIVGTSMRVATVKRLRQRGCTCRDRIDRRSILDKVLHAPAGVQFVLK